MDEVPFLEVIPSDIVLRDYMEDVDLIVSNPEVYAPPKETPAAPNATYQYIYVVVTPE